MLLVRLIEWLQRHGVLDFVNAFTTVVLASFALVELRRARKAERANVSAGYAVLTMTYHRMRATASHWRSDLILAEIRAGLFDPTSIIPDDWGTIMPIVGELGDHVAQLAAQAYTSASQAAMAARTLQQDLVARDRSDGMATLPLDRTRSSRDGQLITLLELVRETATEAERTLYDALNMAPQWARRFRWELKRPPTSTSVTQIDEVFRRASSRRSMRARLRRLLWRK